NQVATLHVRMRSLRAKACAASIPTEMVQLIISAGKIHLPDEPAIFGGAWLQINHAERVATSVRPNIEQRDVTEAFRGSLHRHTRRGVEGRVWHQGHIHLSFGKVMGKGLVWSRCSAF